MYFMKDGQKVKSREPFKQKEQPTALPVKEKYAELVVVNEQSLFGISLTNWMLMVLVVCLAILVYSVMYKSSSHKSLHHRRV